MLRKQVNLDEKDKQVLRILLREPRANIADIAKEAGVQRDTAKYRIERFEKKGLIIKYHTIIEPQTLGLEVFMMVLIKTKPVPEAEIATFLDQVQKNVNVTHISRLIGHYDYLLQVAAVDINDFDRVLKELKQAGQGIIDAIELSSIIDGLKTDDFSGLV